MTCKYASGWSSAYLGGELDSNASAEFEMHLEVCAACAREVREQRELDSRLRAAILAQPVDADGLNRRLQQLLAHQAMPGRAPWRWISTAASVAAALVVAWIVFRVSLPGAKVYADAAEDHRREVVEQQTRRWTSETAAIEAIALGQGVPAAGIHAPESAGYRLERAKLCRLDGRIYLHLVYSDGAQEYSVFFRHREQDPIAEPSSAGDRGSEHLAAFRTADLAAVVVTEQSSDAALRLARLAAHAL